KADEQRPFVIAGDERIQGLDPRCHVGVVAGGEAGHIEDVEMAIHLVRLQRSEHVAADLRVGRPVPKSDPVTDRLPKGRHEAIGLKRDWRSDALQSKNGLRLGAQSADRKSFDAKAYCGKVLRSG